MSWSNYLINKEVWKYTQLLTAYLIPNSVKVKNSKTINVLEFFLINKEGLKSTGY